MTSCTVEEQERLKRYARQMLFRPLGENGQRRLLGSRAVVVGCGALGCGVIAGLARSGIGRIVVIDRDFVQLTDLHRQVLFSESDAELKLPKAEAAAAAVRAVNRDVDVVPIIEHMDHRNIERLLAGADLVVDGTDNFEARFLLNDFSVSRGVPWIYGGCVGGQGTSFTIRPDKGACLRCVFPEPPPASELRTCDTAGVLPPAAAMVSAWQTAQALRLLSGQGDDAAPRQLTFDLWTGDVGLFTPERDPACPCCGRREFPFLSGARSSKTVSLCGSDSVQIVPEKPRPVDLEALACRLEGAGTVTRNRFLLRFEAEEGVLTVFRDGRVIVAGTADVGCARAVCARYLGY